MAKNINYKGRTRKGNMAVLSSYGTPGRGTSVSKVSGRKRNGKTFVQNVVTKIRRTKPKTTGSLFGLKGVPVSTRKVGPGKKIHEFKRRGKQVQVMEKIYMTEEGKRYMYQLRTSKTFGAGYSEEPRYRM